MKSYLFYCFALIFLFSSCSRQNESILSLQTSAFRMTINENGSFSEFYNVKQNKNYIDEDSSTYLLTLRVEGIYLPPISANSTDNGIVLSYEDGKQAEIEIVDQENYFTFELISLTNIDDVELVVWGPYFTTIGKTIGETVGVVRDDDFAIGIQSLNIQTLGGYPWNESDRMPAFNFTTQEDPNNMHPADDGSVLYRVEAGKPTKNGSSLQAYSRNRSSARIISDFKHDSILAPPYLDGAPLSSKIALFGVPTEDALKTIGQIEVNEGLPHPTINGTWGKQSVAASAAYIITDFTEENVDKAIAITQQAGLNYMYHYGKTFENWGHFDLYKGEFPEGVTSLKRCIEKAEAKGIKVGTHFLSNFITSNDPYVTPIPDERLAKVGTSILVNDINSETSEIEIQEPNFFKQMENNNFRTVMIGEELIRYGSVSETSPWILQDCQRGAFNTKANSHPKGSSISKLLDHAYKVFLTEAELTIELSERMARLYNETGLRQISFDGLEGNRSTGLGTYGESLMPYVWYNNLNDELKNHLIIDASRTTHFFWHIYTRMNWGEPWYGGFRESQTEYRFKNQEYFKRNYMPGMLGWFKMTPETSIEDIEWLLARSAGYDAGYAFVANTDALEENGNTDKILARIKLWEELRIDGQFTEKQKKLMRDANREFKLENSSEGILLIEISTTILSHEPKVRQPGEPLSSSVEISDMKGEQVLNFIMSAEKTSVSNVSIEINKFKKIELPITLNAGQKLKYEGGERAIMYGANWQIINEIEMNPDLFTVKDGTLDLSLDCVFYKNEDAAKLKMEIRMKEKTEVLQALQL